ncbi:MAG: 50S ribosomal protein L18 [Verrucomicrobia bacterium]|nr:50S ribosomal protein L18 [Verrucomicrobiota bacterium]
MVTKQELRKRRHWRVRKKVIGTAERPRMSVCFSGRNIHVQFIDDLKGMTLAAVSTTEENFRKADAKKNRANVPFAKEVGRLAAERAISKQIKAVVFDRGGSRYHGKIKTLADAAREVGLVF